MIVPVSIYLVVHRLITHLLTIVFVLIKDIFVKCYTVVIERLIRKIQDHIVAIENELNFSFNILPVKLVNAVNRFRTFKASKPDFKDGC